MPFEVHPISRLHLQIPRYGGHEDASALAAEGQPRSCDRYGQAESSHAGDQGVGGRVSLSEVFIQVSFGAACAGF